MDIYEFIKKNKVKVIIRKGVILQFTMSGLGEIPEGIGELKYLNSISIKPCEAWEIVKISKQLTIPAGLFSLYATDPYATFDGV